MADVNIEEYLSNFQPIERLDLKTLQNELDAVWDYYELNNKDVKESDAGLRDFYRHPVWILNGLFASTDPESRSHRLAIAKYTVEKNLCRIADFGGGSGVTAKIISEYSPKMTIDIIEPYYSNKNNDIGNIRYIKEYEGRYDLIIFQDVLEHMESPLNVLRSIKDKLSTNGRLIFGNCFYPSIKCHLPKTFYLRWTFRLVMYANGFEFDGFVDKFRHLQIYKVANKKEINNSIIFLFPFKCIGILLNILINEKLISYGKKLAWKIKK
jgi:2-polyprenyl-6-hydroxyphenyl methylase/3-demethylubiquinone-9 3-methyltransferase